MSELIFVPQNNYFAGIGKHFNKNLETFLLAGSHLSKNYCHVQLFLY